MPIRSRFTTKYPPSSIPTFVFSSPNTPLPTTPLLISATNPSIYLSLSTFRSLSIRLAVGLLSHGLKPLDRVLISAENGLFYAVLFMGTIMAGGIVAGSPVAFTDEEVRRHVKQVEPRFILAGKGRVETVRRAVEAAEEVWIVDEGPVRDIATGETSSIHPKTEEEKLAATKHWNHLLANMQDCTKFLWDEFSTAIEASRTASLVYTSGTSSGNPKLVELSHANFIASQRQTDYMLSLYPWISASISSSKSLCISPMFQIAAQTSYFIGSCHRQSPVYILEDVHLLDTFEKLLDATLSAVQRLRISVLYLAPALPIILAKNPSLCRKWDLSSLMFIGISGAPLSDSICQKVQENLGGKMVKQGWGMSELAGVGTTWDPMNFSVSASVGELVPDCEAKIVGYHGCEEVEEEERGELWIRGPNVMKGYWRNEEATKAALTGDGWLRTGDVAWADEDGFLFVMDRMVNMIRLDDAKVIPSEYEKILLDHPDVLDAAVDGILTDNGKRLRAYIAVRKEAHPTEEEMAEFFKAKDSGLKQIEGGFVILDEVPRNSGFKIDRARLETTPKRAEPYSGKSENVVDVSELIPEEVD